MSETKTIGVPCRTEVVLIAAPYYELKPASVAVEAQPALSDRRLDAKARSAAANAGYVARKSKWRLNSPDNHGGFMIVDPASNVPAAGFWYDLTAQDVIAWCEN